MKSWLLVLLPIVLSAGVGACSSTAVEPLPAPPVTEAASLPLLAPGFTLGTTLYGGADLSALGTAERALLDTAVTRGLAGFTYYVDWADLEPEAGRYTLDEFNATLDDLQQLGVRPFVNITVGDIEDYNLPERIDQFRGDSTLRTYLTRIAINQALQTLRTRNRWTRRFLSRDREGPAAPDPVADAPGRC